MKKKIKTALISVSRLENLKIKTVENKLHRSTLQWNYSSTQKQVVFLIAYNVKWNLVNDDLVSTQKAPLPLGSTMT